MNVFVFIPARSRGLYAFSTDPTGTNLPPDYAPWKPATYGGKVLRGNYPDDDPRHVLEVIRQEGFFLAAGDREDAIALSD